MTRSALFRGGFVEQNLFSIHESEVLVAPCARGLLVRAFKCELRPLVMIEERGLPSETVMATRTFRVLAVHGKLPAVRFLVAGVALGGGGTINHVPQGHFQVGRLVAA